MQPVRRALWLSCSIILFLSATASCTHGPNSRTSPSPANATKPRLIGDVSEVYYPSLSSLIANSNAVVELTVQGSFRGLPEQSGYTPRFITATVSRVLRGSSPTLGEKVAVRDEGGWNKDGSTVQWGENARWLQTGDKVIAFLVVWPANSKTPLPEGVSHVYSFLGLQGEFLIDQKSGSFKSAASGNALDARLVSQFSADTFETAISHDTATTSSSTSTPALTPTAPPVQLADLTVGGSDWHLIGAPANGGDCFGFGPNPTVADYCIAYSEVNSTDQVYEVGYPNGPAVFGLAMPSVTSVGVKTYQTEFLLTPQNIGFDTSGWKFFVSALNPGDDVVGAKAQ